MIGAVDSKIGEKLWGLESNWQWPRQEEGKSTTDYYSLVIFGNKPLTLILGNKNIPSRDVICLPYLSQLDVS